MEKLVYRLITLIAIATALSGLAQMLMPKYVLFFLDGDTGSANAHSFAIIGMFMLLFGSALTHALISSVHHPVVVLWAGLQKLGAFVAVALAVQNGLFSNLALGVAIFDLVSGILILWYWSKIRKQTGEKRTLQLI